MDSTNGFKMRLLARRGTTMMDSERLPTLMRHKHRYLLVKHMMPEMQWTSMHAESAPSTHRIGRRMNHRTSLPRAETSSSQTKRTLTKNTPTTSSSTGRTLCFCMQLPLSSSPRPRKQMERSSGSLRPTRIRESGWVSSRMSCFLTKGRLGATRMARSSYRRTPSCFQLTETGNGKRTGRYRRTRTSMIKRAGATPTILMVPSRGREVSSILCADVSGSESLPGRLARTQLSSSTQRQEISRYRLVFLNRRVPTRDL